MATEILFPKLGFTMNEGVISEWLVADGGAVSEGQPLLLIEAEKSTQEIEATASGILTILAPTGQILEVGLVIGRIG